MADRSERLVSVITIFLNAEAFLQEAIESVVAQTYGEWELILVDDGTTDGSTDVARRYASQQSERVRYVAHEGHQNLGMSASRNLGIRHARGAFIAFLDADDVWLPEKLERQLALLRRNSGVDMVYGPSRLWYSWTGRAEDTHRDDWRKLGVRSDTLADPPRLLSGYLKNQIPTPATCSVLIRREAVERVGGFEERFRGLYEDQAFFVKIFLTSRVLVSGESWDRYRQHSGSTCAQAAEVGEYHPELPHPTRLIFLTWLRGYLSDPERADPSLLRRLDRQIRLYRYPTLYRLLTRTKLLPRKTVSYALEKGIAFVFRFGRRVLPGAIRQWVWSQWFSHPTDAVVYGKTTQEQDGTSAT